MAPIFENLKVEDDEDTLSRDTARHTKTRSAHSPHVLPITILIGCLILGGFYYATQASKQRSIEKQQQVELEEKRRVEATTAADQQRMKEEAEAAKAKEVSVKANCISEAERRAMEQRQSLCERSPYLDCSPGSYLVAHYDTYLEECLMRNGLE